MLRLLAGEGAIEKFFLSDKINGKRQKTQEDALKSFEAVFGEETFRPSLMLYFTDAECKISGKICHTEAIPEEIQDYREVKCF